MESKDLNPSWLDHSLFPFTSRLLEIEGNQIHYIDEGSGPTLLLLHGNPTWSFLYRHIVARLHLIFDASLWITAGSDSVQRSLATAFCRGSTPISSRSSLTLSS